MDGGMNDELEAIVEAEDKAALDAYADARGISLDRRRSFANMLADLRAAMDAPAEEPDAWGAELNTGAADLVHEDFVEAAPASQMIVGDVEPSADEIAEIGDAWARSFAADVKSVSLTPEVAGLRVVLVTKHGRTEGLYPLAGPTRDDIMAALGSARRAFVGE